jgi:putative ABC transport system permease protein
MKKMDMIKFAVTGLKRRKARTFLTVLGVIIGTVCIILMAAVGLSSYRQFEESFLADQSLTEITVTDYSQGGGIRDSVIRSMETVPHVKTVSPVIELPVTIYAGKYRAALQMKGIEPEAIDVTYEEGNVFKSGAAVPALVCGGNTLQSYIDPENPPDYTDYEAMETYRPDVDLMETELTMILGSEPEEENGGEAGEMPLSRRYRVQAAGITEQSYSESSYDTYMDLSAARQIIRENRELARYLGIEADSYTTVKIIADDMEHVEDVLDEIKKLGYETYSPVESVLQVQEEQARQQGQLFAIGFISLLVSAIGIANTMYANILERRRDIGVMKVAGMKIRWIRELFIIESAMIGILGGVIGIVISYLTALAVNAGGREGSFLGMYFSEGMEIMIPWQLSAAALSIALTVGILSGIYPAYKAAKMSALEAMRK